MATTASIRRPYRVGMFGGGVVGGGVYELIQKHFKGIIEIVQIAVKDTSKPRSFEIDSSITTVTTNPNDILNNNSLDCIIEVMGGVTLARTVVTTSLHNHKSVVTANKALLAQDLNDWNTLCSTNNTPLCYEAAVCGGIPIIHLLQTCYAGDTIRSIRGICNGTTNYMLGQMEAGQDYGEALKEAQELGYAEADPTADVEGYDVRAKIGLLAKLAFGTTVSQDEIPCQGISHLTTEDFSNAASMNSTIKLLGVAQVSAEHVVSVYVAPHMVPNTHLLATAKGSGNAVIVDSENMGLCSYTGPGAGRYPTANSVVADVARLATQFHNHNQSSPQAVVSPPFPRETNWTVESDYYSVGQWYVRLESSDKDAQPDVSALEIAAKLHNVNIVEYHGSNYITLQPCQHSNVQAFANSIGSKLYMPII